ncbi:MAG: putative toxin-antitoxin system toxin component, PIN family [Spirosomaceae bacterium]|jgi:putative PIN family toxin of toxin-antitoxin system|nr:putative toxin-antitoxin system toxin component, PIN family [Spirosomataceae bacterium]
MRVVIDTNVLIATINRKNPEFFIYQAFAKKTFEWVVSTEILMEYAEKITEYYSSSTADFILRAICIANNTIFAEPHFRWNLINEDPDDNKFADLAISVNAFCLITYDKHFDILSDIEFPTLKVVTPTEFKKIIDII